MLWANEAPKVRTAWAVLALVDGARFEGLDNVEHDYARPGGYLMQDIGFLAGLRPHSTIDRTVGRLEDIGLLVRRKPRHQRALYTFVGRPMIDPDESDITRSVRTTLLREIWRADKGRMEIWLKRRIGNCEKALYILLRSRMPRNEDQMHSLERRLNWIMDRGEYGGRWGRTGRLSDIERLELAGVARGRRRA